jgi:hypothetical protein
LASKPLAQSVAAGNDEDVVVPANAFALIDGYIYANRLVSVRTSTLAKEDQSIQVVRLLRRPGFLAGYWHRLSVRRTYLDLAQQS